MQLMFKLAYFEVAVQNFGYYSADKNIENEPIKKYEGHTVGFQTFFVWTFKVGVDSW